MDIKTYLSRRSRRELADALGVTPPLISQWLSGHRRISPETALRIERATNGAVTREELRPDIFLREGISHRSDLRPAEPASSPRGSATLTPAREEEELHD